MVIGGGNTAIDAATQARPLGAEDVTIVYRRGPEQMTATHKEQAWAQTNDVRIRHWAAPVRLIAGAGARQVRPSPASNSRAPRSMQRAGWH